MGMRRLRDAGALPLDGRSIVTDRDDLIYFAAREIVSRGQAAAATDMTARIAHIAAAECYAVRVVELRAAIALY